MSQDKLHRIITHFIEDNVVQKLDDRLPELYKDYPNPDLVTICAYHHQHFNRLFDFMNQKLDKPNRHYNANQSRELRRLIKQLQILQDECSAVNLEIILIPAYQEIVNACQQFLQESGGSPIPDTFQHIQLISHDPVIQIKSTEQTVCEYINQKPLQEEELPISEAVRRKIIKDKSQLGIRWENDLSKEDFIAPFSFSDKFEETLSSEDFIDYAESGFLYPLNRELLDFDEVLMWLKPQEFLAFLCRSIHPAVRPDNKEEVAKLKSCFNQRLRDAGYEIIAVGKDSGEDTFEAKRTSIQPQPSSETEKLISCTEVKKRINQCKEKLSNEDYEGVILTAHTLLDACICDIYKRKTSKQMPRSRFDKKFERFYQHCCNDLDNPRMQELKDSMAKLKEIADTLRDFRNDSGGGHAQGSEPTRFEAKTCLNTTITLLEYLYDITLHNSQN